MGACETGQMRHGGREGGRGDGDLLLQCKEFLIVLYQQFYSFLLLRQFLHSHHPICNRMGTAHQGGCKDHTQILTVHLVLVVQ